MRVVKGCLFNLIFRLSKGPQEDRGQVFPSLCRKTENISYMLRNTDPEVSINVAYFP